MLKRARVFFQTKKSKTAAYTLLFAVLVSLCIVYAARHEIKSLYANYSITHSLKEFTDHCFAEFPATTDTQKINNLRHCIYINTMFSVDKQKYGDVWQNRPAMIKWLSDYSSQKRMDPPPMECFYRAKTLSRALRELGYEAHAVVLTSDVDNFFDHVTVEVLNPDTKNWELQGPSYDVQYVSLKDKTALGVKELLTEDFSKFVPCAFDGTCGWTMKTQEGFDVVQTQKYLGSAYIKREKIMYLSRGVDENKRRNVYGKQMSFCEWHPQFCENIVRLDKKK